MKIMFIDDDRTITDMLGVLFWDNPNVAVVECHSKEQALKEIADFKPQVLFLDHSLDKNSGSEGFEIADALSGSGVKIFSITGSLDEEIKVGYLKRGIEVIGKTNINRMEEIVMANIAADDS